MSVIADENTRGYLSEESKALFTRAIKVISVGGGGGNALNHLLSHGVIEGIDVLAADTDERTLKLSRSNKKLLLGENITKGTGAGSRPDVGELVAKESIQQIRSFIDGSDMVYIAAGMGGGTGTGAAPIIAHTAHEMGILTVAVVTKPFTFEGKRRMRIAKDGINKLFKEVDAIIVVPNQRLIETADAHAQFIDCFALVDEVLRQAVQGVTDLITRSGLVNVDFADLRTIMKNAGHSVMGIGTADGEGCVKRAVSKAIESPLMECSMKGAKGILMNISYKNDLPIQEVGMAAAIVEDLIDEDANFIWGCVKTPMIKSDVEVTIIAAGFDEYDEDEKLPAQPEPVKKTEPTREPSRAAKTNNNNRRSFDSEQKNTEPAEPIEEQTVYVQEKQRKEPVKAKHSSMPGWLAEAQKTIYEQKKKDNELPEFIPRRSSRWK